MACRNPLFQIPCFVSLVLLAILTSPTRVIAATVYADGATGGVGDWTIFDNNPAGAAITSAYEVALHSDVIRTTGAKTSNGYRLGGTRPDSSCWNNTSEFFVRWTMAHVQP